MSIREISGSAEKPSLPSERMWPMISEDSPALAALLDVEPIPGDEELAYLNAVDKLNKKA